MNWPWGFLLIRHGNFSEERKKLAIDQEKMKIMNKKLNIEEP